MLMLNHSQKKRNEKMETRVVFIEISLVFWNSPNSPRHRGSSLRNMTNSEGIHLLARTFHAIMYKIKTDILQIAEKWNLKWIFIHQGYFFREIPAINVSFAPNYVYLQGWSLKFRQNIKMFQPKYWNLMYEQTQVNKS